jgi:hypothetical protein
MPSFNLSPISCAYQTQNFKLFIMRKHQLLNLTFLFCASLLFQNAVHAKVWRVNNNAGVSADFASLTLAFNSAAVQNDDTLYIEGSATSYTSATLSKRLILIGTGYLLSGPGANLGLQANSNPANLSSIYVDSLASGSTFMGLSGYFQIDSRTDDLKFIRTALYFDVGSVFANSIARNWIINKCLIGLNLNYPLDNIQITNSIARYSIVNTPNVTNGLIRNNIFTIPLITSNSYISNNIFTGSLTATNCAVKYNISNANNLPAGFNNQVNISESSLFVGSGSDDGRYMLAANSPAIGAGEPINGVTPDAGAFGTADPYRLSGIPAIPTIYSLTVPASIPANATSMTITFSTRSNN